MFIFFSNSFITNQLVKWWEYETITGESITEPFDIGILLGGFTNPDIIPGHDRLNFGFSANRFLNTYELYKMGKIKKILITGGSGRIIGKSAKEALLVKSFLLKLGVSEKDIIIETDSRNTYENAVFTKKMLRSMDPDATSLLITSAFHMRRAIGCFEAQNIRFVPFSVDHFAEIDRWSPEHLIIPDVTGFYYWELMIREWIGCLVYFVQGYL